MTADTSIEAAEVDAWYESENESADQAGLDDPSDVNDPAAKYADSQIRVIRETKDYQLDYLRHALQPGRELIDISPAYQRRLRWANKKKSLLIESFLLNIPVPPIFLYERDYNEYEVIDGRQRLDAVSTFLSNDYALSGLEYWPELNRRRFLDLPLVLQKGLLRRSLPAVVLLAETRSVGDRQLDVRRVLFDRLNTGGIRLNPQELRNALYPGSFNALLISLARSDPFTNAWKIPHYVSGEELEPSDELLANPLFASLADAELVLRFFALRDADLEGRRGSLRSILDRYMKEQSSASEESLEELRRLFLSVLEKLLRIFDGQPFRLPTTGRLSRPLYDALMIALSKYSGVELAGEPIRDALSDAFSDPIKYDILVGRGNTISAVHERVELAGDILASGRTAVSG